jgi:hypothetical protein
MSKPINEVVTEHSSVLGSFQEIALVTGYCTYFPPLLPKLVQNMYRGSWPGIRREANGLVILIQPIQKTVSFLVENKY